MKLLKEKDFIWKVKKINNIESNPIEYWYTVYYERDSARKINDGYKYDQGVFKRAFKTMEEAKHRAYEDYCMIFGYVRSFFDF